MWRFFLLRTVLRSTRAPPFGFFKFMLAFYFKMELAINLETDEISIAK